MVKAYAETMFIVHVQPLLHSVNINVKTAARSKQKVSGRAKVKTVFVNQRQPAAERFDTEARLQARGQKKSALRHASS